MPVFMEVEKALHRQKWTKGRAPWVIRLVWRTAYIGCLAFLGALIPFFAQLGGEGTIGTPAGGSTARVG